jgi:DNA repair protein RecN (Recombination protein N)
VARELEGLAPLDPALAPLGERLRAAHAEIEDVARALGRYGEGIRVDPGRLEEIEERLYLIGRLLRKHGGSVAAALERQGSLEKELAELGSFEDTLAAKQGEVEAARGLLAGIAARLSERRRKAARGLGRRVDETLAELGFASAHLEVALEERGELGLRGSDRVRFLFKPNPGEEARPLQRVASGGELSRVMLAVKRALATADEALLYVFDEIDTGVGGATAEVIGRKLKAIAAERQVLAVTHLPQIAAAADRHVRVSKEATRARTTVRVEALGDDARAAEVARMLGGAQPSSEAAAHAAEMLRRARSAN